MIRDFLIEFIDEAAISVGGDCDMDIGEKLITFTRKGNVVAVVNTEAMKYMTTTERLGEDD